MTASTTALNRAIRDPLPVQGLATRSPLAGLARRSVGFVDVLGQSVGAVAPSAAAATTPALIAARAGQATFLAIVVAAVLMAFAAFAVNQFTRRLAATGSLYTFTAKGLGVGAGFATSAALLAGYGFIAMFALVGGGFYAVTLLSHLAPGLADSRGLVVLFILAFGALCFVVLRRGIRVSTRVTLVAELGSIAAILVLIVVLLVRMPASAFAASLQLGPLSFGTLAAGTTAAVVAFVGFESAATLGVEARRPFATIPRTIRWTVIGSGLLYLLATYTQLAGFNAFGGSLLGSAAPVNELAAKAGVEWIGVLLDAGLTCSFVACALASTTALSRVLFSLGREGIAPSALGRTHPRFQTPHLALAVAVPVVVAGPIVLLATGRTAAETMSVLLVCAAAGSMTAYALVSAAAPLFLRKIGELTIGTAVACWLTAAALIGVLGTDLALEVSGPRSLAVWVLAGVAVLSALAYLICRRRRTAALSRIGLYDETTGRDVLGGAATIRTQ